MAGNVTTLSKNPEVSSQKKGAGEKRLYDVIIPSKKSEIISWEKVDDRVKSYAHYINEGVEIFDIKTFQACTFVYVESGSGTNSDCIKNIAKNKIEEFGYNIDCVQRMLGEFHFDHNTGKKCGIYILFLNKIDEKAKTNTKKTFVGKIFVRITQRHH